MHRLNRKIGMGVFWNLANLLMSRGATIVFTLVLARLLAPEAFGLIAMVTVVFEIAGVFVQSGLGQALIRSKQVSQADLSTVFIVNMVLSGLAYGALFFSAQYIADFYSQPELALLIRVMGGVIFLNATTIVQTAVCSREMNFKVLMKANTLGVVISGIVAVSAAYQGAGVWSLVLQVLVSSSVSAAVLWLSSGWRPSFQFSAVSFQRLFHFGASLLVEGMLSVLYQNSYILVIGRFFSAELTGLYFFARKVSNLLSMQLTDAVQQATFPALATLQDDNALLRHKYRQIIQLMMFMIAPVMLLMAGLAQPLFLLLFDKSWQGAVPYLQLFCLTGMLFPLHAMNINILNVKGRSDLVLKVGFVKKAVYLALLFAAIPFGVMGIVVSQVIGSVLALIPNTYFSARLIDYGFKNQLLDTFKPVLAATLAALTAWAYVTLSSLPLFWLLSVAGGLGFLIYLLVSLIIRVEGLMLVMRKVKQRYMDRRAAV